MQLFEQEMFPSPSKNPAAHAISPESQPIAFPPHVRHCLDRFPEICCVCTRRESYPRIERILITPVNMICNHAVECWVIQGFNRNLCAFNCLTNMHRVDLHEPVIS